MNMQYTKEQNLAFFPFTLHSCVDLITNSSTEIYTWFGESTINAIKELLVEILKMVGEEKNIEGFVLDFGGTRLKVKTESYTALHRIKTDMSERHVIDVILNDELDDVKSKIQDKESLDKLNEFEHRVITHLNSIIEKVDAVLEILNENNASFKDAAIEYKGHEFFPLIMGAHRGKDLESMVKVYFKRNIRKQYSTRSLLNINF